MRQCKFTRIWIVLCATLLWTVVGLSRAHADSWGPPQPTHWSENRQFVLRVDDDHNILTLQQKKDARFLTLWSIPYPQAWAPYTAFVTDDGRYVVLQDRHGNLGRGKVFRFLDPSGRVLKSYSLEQLLTQSEILGASASISSIWWSMNSQSFFTAHQTRFACVTQRGTIRCFDLATGNRLDHAIEVKQQIHNEAILRARNGLFSFDEPHRITSITQVGALGDRTSLPTLTSLLDFEPHANHLKTADALREERELTQCEAAGAMVTLLKAKAAPLLEARLDRGTSYWTCQWLQMYPKTGQARYSPKILRMTQSHDKDIRTYAVRALLDGGNPALIRQHRAWLTDKDVNYEAVSDLSDHGTRQDLPLLRMVLHDKDDRCELWALQGLIRLHAPELPRLLQRYLHSRKNPSARQEAKLELARRGDRVQLQRLVAWVWSLRNHSHENARWADEEMTSIDIWEILAARRPPGLIPALRAAGKNPSVDIQRRIIEGGAVIGDVSALNRLRRLARVGDALDRAESIHWLALSKDHGSERFLKSAQHDEDPIVQEAANQALKMLAQEDSNRR